MINPPRTIEGARVYRYSRCAERPGGFGYIESHCAYLIRAHGHQCGRLMGHGPAKLYCKQHAKMVEGAPHE